MWSQRTLLGLVLGLTAALAASAQSNGSLRWRSGGTAIGLQVGHTQATPVRAQEVSVSLQGRTAAAPELGVYGRVGAPLARGANTLGGAAGDTGRSYGVGVSWDLSRDASAVLGWDTYDIRGVSGESRDIRSTRLGLQWRY